MDTLNQHLQNCIVRLLATDGEFCGLVAPLVKPELIPGATSRTVAGICLRYFAEHKGPIQEHLLDEVKSLLADRPDDAPAVNAYLERLFKVQPNRGYVLKRINDWVKQREYERGAIEFADLVEQGDFEAAQNRMYDVLRSGIQQMDAGLDYLTDLSSLATRGDRVEYLMGTGVDALDRIVGGFRRGQFIVLAGGYKAGKSWGMQHFTRVGLEAGLKVLYVSHELTQEELELRFDMMFTGRGTKPGERVRYGYRDEESGEAMVDTVTVKSVYDNDAVRRARAAMRRFGGQLKIRKYPMGSCTMAELERLLNYLETYESFIPDVLINDYADIMDVGNGQELRHGLSDTYIGHKRIADERDILVITASQIATSFLGKKSLSQAAPAEDKRKSGHCDMMLGIARTEEDVRLSVARIHVMATRSTGGQHSHCFFSPCLDIGQWCMASWLGDTVVEGLMDAFAADEEDTGGGTS